MNDVIAFLRETAYTIIILQIFQARQVGCARAVLVFIAKRLKSRAMGSGYIQSDQLVDKGATHFIERNSRHMSYELRAV
jgi:hypothetical protein